MSLFSLLRVIENDGTDLANDLAGKRYVTIEIDHKKTAIAEINAALEGLTLFPKEQEYIDLIISSIMGEEAAEIINMDKKAGLEYIALHGAKVAAVEEVKTDMGDLADSEDIYNYIGGQAIEAAHSAGQIAEAMAAAIKKMEELKEILGDAYTIGYNKAKAELPTDAEGAAGHTVTITKGDKTLKLVNPDKVTYGKQE